MSTPTTPETPELPKPPTSPRTAASLKRLLDLFDEIVDLEPDLRAARLAEIAATDDESARELAAMLESASAGHELEIERSLGDRRDASRESGILAAGSEVGAYRIVRPLGRGGMGEVYLATRDHGRGFEQSVALKLLRSELASPQAIERFHRECRIQARLANPAIVPLLDVGVAGDGRPFLVLQFVQGQPITTYADAHRLTLAERLRLVVVCCRAVESAHAQLVVHRDLKPSNILVDDDGAVRLLDFGIAKVLDQDEDGELTRVAPAPMTPERAAPEQLRGDPSTTGTDVWGLGVLLYELVTGRLPFAPHGRDPRAIEREIRERGPTRPVRALPQGDDEAARDATAALVHNRSTTPRRLTRELSGDLEVILLRALAAEPERRYPSVAALADDLERHLEGRPVAARADSWGYRTRRFVARHRVGVAAAAVAIVGLAALTLATAIQSRRIERERDRATALERESTAVVELLIELFGATAPNRGAGVGEISIDALLAQGAAKAESIPETPSHSSGVRERMLATLGRIRVERSEFPAARELFERAREIADRAGGDLAAGLALPSDERLALEFDYTQLLARMDDGVAARGILTPLVARLERARPPRAAQLAEALAQLSLLVPAAEAPPLAERALELRRALDPPRPVEVAASLDALGVLAFRRGEPAQAHEAWSRSLLILEREVGEVDLRTLSTLNNLAAVTEDPKERLSLQRRVLTIQERRFGAISGPVANLWNNLGIALAQIGDYEQAEAALRKSYQLRIQVLGVDHRETVSTLRNIARIAELRGHYPEALQIFDDVLARLPKTGLPRDGWPTYEAQRAAILWRLGRLDAAHSQLARAISGLRATYPEGHDELAAALLTAARLAAAAGDAAAARTLSQEALTSREARLPAGSPKIEEARAELGRALVLKGETKEGQAMLAAALPALDGWGLLHPDDRAALAAALGTELRPRVTPSTKR